MSITRRGGILSGLIFMSNLQAFLSCILYYCFTNPPVCQELLLLPPLTLYQADAEVDKIFVKGLKFTTVMESTEECLEG